MYTFLQIILILAFPCGNILAQVDMSHSCSSDEDCQDRLSQRWPYYTFQCCTSVLCNEQYGYYLVHSGCTAEKDCSPETQVRVGDRLAARIPISVWMPMETQLLENCPRTKQDFSNLQNVQVDLPSFPQAPPLLAPLQPALHRRRPTEPRRNVHQHRSAFQTPRDINPTRFPPPPSRPAPSRAQKPSALVGRPTGLNTQSVSKLAQNAMRPTAGLETSMETGEETSFPKGHRGKCPRMQQQCESVGKRQECCVRIRCRPKTIREIDENMPSPYKFEERCLPKCDLNVERYGNMYTFYFPFELYWGNRDQYWNYALEPPENSCAETRYFFNFVKEEGKFTKK